MKEAAAAKLHFLLELQHHLGGRIPVERWVQEALYHAEFGYYTASIREFGRQGDFTTWPLLNEGLARAIANWALEHRPSGRWNLIEIGAGAGTLAVSVIKAIGWWNRPRYRIVEISPRLRRAQQDRLGSSAVWHDSVLEALAASAGKALIFSNELVDAFPCRVFAKHSGSWRELSLGIEGGRVSELWRDPKSLPGSSAFSHSWPDGQRIEVRECYQAWLQEWLPGWESGCLLTIDYGDVCPDLYFRRPGGTLRAYAHHQRLEGRQVYAGFGLRDITADVNFSDLQMPSAFSNTEFTTLAAFISKHARSQLKGRSAELLLRPGGAGDAFKVLVQKR